MNWERDEIKKELTEQFGEEFAEEIEGSLDLEKGNYSSWGEAGSVTIDGTEYSIIKDEDEAYRIAVEAVKQDLEDEPDMFEQGWLMGHVDTGKAENLFTDIYNEMNNSYAEDIKSESSKTYTNRLAEEMVHKGIITEEEGVDEEFNLDDKIDEFVQPMTQGQIEEGEGGLSYYRDNFGDFDANSIIKDNNLIDIEAAADDAVDIDGWPHFLSRYDGNYETTKGGLVFFRQD